MQNAAILLTNYLRPNSILKQLNTFIAVCDRFDVYIIDNAPRESNLRSQIRIEDWYYYIENGANLGAGYRFLLSNGLPHHFFIAIDDDIFLTIDQLMLLYGALLADPRRVHGIWGQTIDLTAEVARLRSGGIRKYSAHVHVIQRVYAYTPSISFRSVCIAREVGFDAWQDIGPTDDILLSAASFEAPMCHPLDELSVCETSDTVGIAQWKADGFIARRDRLVGKLLELGCFGWRD